MAIKWRYRKPAEILNTEKREMNICKSTGERPLQQGDVLLEKVSAKIDDVKKFMQEMLPKNGHIVLAEGETTGHFHGIAEEEDVKLYTLDELMLLVVEKEDGVELTHQEHGPIRIPHGIHKITGVQEYDYEKELSRRVLD